MTTPAARASAMAAKARADQEAKRAANRARYPKFAAFFDAINAQYPGAKVARFYPEACE